MPKNYPLPKNLSERLAEREGLSKDLKDIGLPIFKKDGENRLGAQMKELHQLFQKPN